LCIQTDMVRRRQSLSSLAAVLALLLGGSGCGHPSESPSRRVVEDLPIDSRPAGWLALPSRRTSVKFAVIGDSGRGWRPQHEVAAQMAAYRERFPFDFVVMTGDNIYEGPATERDYRLKFEEPYARLLTDGVRFHAVLGNHDDPRQRFYPLFNMQGHRYYTFRAPAPLLSRLEGEVRFFALDSTNLDRAQRAWLDEQLRQSRARWNICVLHHPLYSPGRYPAHARVIRWLLESAFVEHGVDAVFSGHEHVYVRTRLQRGIQYFVSGAAGSLRRGDARPAPFVARSYDDDFHFMLVEIDGDELHFQAITRQGRTVDAGVLRKEERGRRAADSVSGVGR
jgi:predicted phosphodiesterase